MALILLLLLAQHAALPDRREMTLLGLPIDADSATTVRRLGQPDSLRARTMYFAAYQIHFRADGTKDGVHLVRRGPATARGVRVGDRADRALRTYGTPAGRDSTYLQYDIEGDEHGPVMLITLRRGTITRIFVGYPVEENEPSPRR